MKKKEKFPPKHPSGNKTVELLMLTLHLLILVAEFIKYQSAA